MNRSVGLALLASLAACGHAAQQFDVPSAALPPKPKTVDQVCLRIDDWTKDEKKALGIDLAPFPSGSLVTRLAIEWNRLRLESMACAAAE